MSYQLDIQIQADFLRIDIMGERRPGYQAEDAQDMWQTIANACDRYKAASILCISQLTGPLPPMAAYGAASSLADLFRGKQVRIAYVLSNDRTSIQSNAFAETVAQNRGFQGKMFLTEQDAIDWLMEGMG